MEKYHIFSNQIEGNSEDGNGVGNKLEKEIPTEFMHAKEHEDDVELPETKRRKEIFEDSLLKREGILLEMMGSRAADIILNLVPGVDILKMGSEVLLAKTSSGVELSPRERKSYALIIGFVSLFYALELAGMTDAATLARISGAAVSFSAFGPATIKKGVDSAMDSFSQAKEKLQPALHIFMKVGEYLRNKKELVQEVAKDMAAMVTKISSETEF